MYPNCHVPWFTTFIEPFTPPVCCLMDLQERAIMHPPPDAAPAAWVYIDEDLTWWREGPEFQRARELVAGRLCGTGRRCGDQHLPWARVRSNYDWRGGSESFLDNLEAALTSMRKGEARVGHVPLHWTVTAGYVCPNLCRHCCQVPLRSPENALMPLDKARILARYSEKARFWELTGGESLAIPDDHLDLLLPPHQHVATNVFTSLNVPLAKLERWLPRINAMSVSLDSCRPETYEYIKRNCSYAHLREAMELATERNIAISGVYVLMRSNLQELENAPDVWQSLGISRFMLSRVVVTDTEDPEALNEDIFIGDPELDARLRKTLDYVSGRCLELGISFCDQGVGSYLATRKV